MAPAAKAKERGRLPHRDRDAGSLGHVLDRDREDHEEAEAGAFGGKGGSDREALWEAVDEEHQKDEPRGAGALAAAAHEAALGSKRRPAKTRKATPIAQPARSSIAEPSSAAGGEDEDEQLGHRAGDCNPGLRAAEDQPALAVRRLILLRPNWLVRG
jgi:hypothetical protein